MKCLARWLSLVAAFAALTWFGSTVAVSAAEEDRVGPGDRLDRLERRVNEMAQRQEQVLRELGARQQRQGPAAMERSERMRQRQPVPGVGQMPRPERPVVRPGLAAPPVPEAPKVGKEILDLVRFCLFVGFIMNILIAIWIFTDIRKRGEGSGVFVALALLAGIPTAIIYAIVRIGDRKA